MEENQIRFQSELLIGDVLKALPHRYPFVLIDRVLSRTRSASPEMSKSRVGWSISALKNVSYNEHYFVGHFPGRPVMPGVLQIEAMAQAACLAVVDPDGPKVEVAIVGINEARFRKPVVPGDQCIIEAEILKDRGSMLVIQASMKVNNEVASEAELMARIVTASERS